MSNIIKNIEKKIIISCQASTGEPFYKKEPFIAMAESVINGGAEVLRLEGAENIKTIKENFNVTVIGITKPEILPPNWKEIVYITPTFHDAKEISDAGADIIAIDGTLRPRPKETLEELILKIKNELKKPVMADISTLEEAHACQELGADIISTTLSGYTQSTLDKNNEEPDFKLLEELVNNISCPIILEGRIWEIEHVQKAFKIGAHAVVIGSAVTRPQLITKRFINSIK